MSLRFESPSEADFGKLAKLATAICQSTMACLTVTDERGLSTRAKIGLADRESPLDFASVIVGDTPVLVPDTAADERFRRDPLRAGGKPVRFFAGLPLRAAAGECVGTLCVMDENPKTLAEWQVEGLESLARQAVLLLGLERLKNCPVDRDRGFLASIAQNMAEGALIQDESGKIEMTNPAALHLLGLSEDELLGRVSSDPRWRAIHENGAPYAPQEHPAIRALATGEPQLGRIMGIAIAGQGVRWLLINSRLFDGDGPAKTKKVLSTFVDITAEIETNRNLKLLGEKHRLVLDNIPALVAYWDRHERCHFANQAYSEWFGKSPAELLGSTMREILGPALYQSNRAHVEGALRGEHQNFDRDLVFKASGETRHTSAHYIPDISEGTVRGFYAIVFDVSEIKSLEQIAQKEAKFAVQAMQAKSEFLANMSHEIRTPLNGVLGMTSLLRDTPLDATQREYLGILRASADTLLTIVNDILDFSKAEAGKIEIEILEFGLSTLFLNIERPLGIAAKSKGLQFEISVDPGLPSHLKGDPTRIGQVLMNLIHNAIKFTPEGSVKLEASLKRPPSGKAEVLFEVSDTGIGIAETSVARLFAPFSQADSSTTRKFGGTGLGLSICKHLVTLMGGEIGVRSQPGIGSVFWFSIPFEAGRASAEDRNAGDASAYPGAKRLRILIAEDSSVNQLIAKKMLESLGHSVVTVGNGREAVDALQMGQFDLVFMDCHMPELDGYEATRQIRGKAGALFQNIPIIAMTASAMAGDREKCLASGMNDYVSKPLDTPDLSLVIDRSVRG